MFKNTKKIVTNKNIRNKKTFAQRTSNGLMSL